MQRADSLIRRIAATLLIAPMLWLMAPELTVRADSDSLDPKLEATVHLKILAYDRALKKRSGGKLLIAVLYAKDSAGSKSDAYTMANAFEDAGVSKNMEIQGMKPNAVALPLESELARKLVKAGATAVYVPPELAEQQDRVTRVATQKKLPTLGRTRGQVEAGLAIGVVARSGRPRIVINLRAAKAAGMDLDSRVLALGDVLR